jgi:hypothetical protein
MSQQIELNLHNSRRDLNPEYNDGRSFTPVTIRFKLVFSTTIRFYTICPDWTTRQLKSFIRPYVTIDFGLENFDIVEAGLPDAERASSLRISSNFKIRDIVSNMDYLCFYIRPQSQNQNQNQNTDE